MFLYIGSRLTHHPAISGYIERLFPASVYFPGMLVFLFGNAILLFQVLLAPVVQQEEAEASTETAQTEHFLAANRQQEEYGLVLPLLFIPLFWLFTCTSAYRALRKILTPSLRSHWDLSIHGHASDKLTQLQTAANLTVVKNEETA